MDDFHIQVNSIIIKKNDWFKLKILLTFKCSLGMTNAEVLSQVEHGYRMPMPPNCTPALYEIMLECWHKDPMRRPTFETLQWKLEDFYTLDQSEYKEAHGHWSIPESTYGTVNSVLRDKGKKKKKKI
jgi:hypothetical protein